MEQTTYETTITSNNESFSSSKNMSASEQLGVKEACNNNNSDQSRFKSKIQSVPLTGNWVRQPSNENQK